MFVKKGFRIAQLDVNCVYVAGIDAIQDDRAHHVDLVNILFSLIRITKKEMRVC